MAFKDSLQAVELLLLLGKNIDLVSVLDMLSEVIGEDVELLMEDRLRRRVERYLRMRIKRTLLGYLNGALAIYLVCVSW